MIGLSCPSAVSYFRPSGVWSPRSLPLSLSLSLLGLFLLSHSPSVALSTSVSRSPSPFLPFSLSFCFSSFQFLDLCHGLRRSVSFKLLLWDVGTQLNTDQQTDSLKALPCGPSVQATAADEGGTAKSQEGRGCFARLLRVQKCTNRPYLFKVTEYFV